MQVSVNWLAENLQMHGATVRKRITDVKREKDGRVNLRAACEAIFGAKIRGASGEFIPTPEANRRLILAKEAEIALDMEIKRGERIPKADVILACNMVFKSITGILKANRNKTLTDQQINEMFDTMRLTAQQLRHDYGNGSVLIQATS